jgi:hypothetical protein
MKQRLKKFQYEQGKTSESFNDEGAFHVYLAKKKKKLSYGSFKDLDDKKGLEDYSNYSLMESKNPK